MEYYKNCFQNDWLKASNETIHFLTPDSSFNNSTFSLYAGLVSSFFSKSNHLVWPTLYLKSNINIISGDGTINNPYTLS